MIHGERDWRSFGRPPTTDDLLNRHLHRTGADRAAATDPAAQLQVAMLRDFLGLLRAALDDEHTDPETARRIIERVMYGAAPQPAATEQMNAERVAWAESLATQPPPTIRVENGHATRAGYEQAVSTLADVAQRTGSPAARWAADYLTADPDRQAPTP